MTSGVSQLLQDLQGQGLWRASSLRDGGDLHGHGSCSTGTASGFPDLDRHLPDAGWPTSGVTELLCRHVGIGEFRLLAPALASLTRETQRWLIMVRPPYIPYPPALLQAGVDLERILICQPGNRRDYLWAIENALASGSCSGLLAWPGRIDSRQIRRLQVASREGRSWAVLFRHDREARQASPAELRIHLSPGQPYRDASALSVRILKRRGGWESGNITLRFNDELHRPAPDFSEMLIPAASVASLAPEPGEEATLPSPLYQPGRRHVYQ